MVLVIVVLWKCELKSMCQLTALSYEGPACSLQHVAPSLPLCVANKSANLK